MRSATVRPVVGLLAAALLATGCTGGAGGAGQAVRAQGPPPFWGLVVPGARTDLLDELAGRVGRRPQVAGLFVKLDSDFAAVTLHRLRQRGIVPFLTLEPWSWRSRPGAAEDPEHTLASLVQGRHDEALRRFARELRRFGHPVYLRFAHEMNGDWYPWAVGVNGGSAQDYVAAWRHVRHVVESEAPGLASWVWAPNVVDAVPGDPPLGPLYPGDAFVDYAGVTGYGREDTPAETFDDTLEEIGRTSGRPVLLAEVGATGPARRTWLAGLAGYVRERGVRGVVWFNTSPETTGATGDYRIDQDPADLRAFTRMITALDDHSPSTS